MPSAERLLVKTPNWLGDLVLFHPALRALRHACPDVHLGVLVPERLSTFYRGAGWIDRVVGHPWPVGWRLSRHVAIARSLRRHRFDRALLATRSFESALWVALGGIPQRVGVAREGRGPLLTRALPEPRAWRRGHPADVFPELLSALSAAQLVATPAAPDIDADSLRAVDDWLAAHRRHSEALIALAPASAVAEKRWPIERWAQLVDLLVEGGTECVLVVAPWEAPIARTVLASAQSPALIQDTLDVAGLLALLARCDGCVGNDSGATHAAAALGIPTVAVFRRTDPRVGAPRGRHTRPVGPATDPLGPTVAQVTAALASLRPDVQRAREP